MRSTITTIPCEWCSVSESSNCLVCLHMRLLKYFLCFSWAARHLHSKGAYWHEGLKWLSAVVSRPWTGTNSLKILLLWTLARALQSVRALLVLNQTYELTERKRNRISERKERITVWYNQEKKGVWWRDRHERDGETERVKWLTLDVIRIWRKNQNESNQNEERERERELTAVMSRAFGC